MKLSFIRNLVFKESVFISFWTYLILYHSKVYHCLLRWTERRCLILDHSLLGQFVSKDSLLHQGMHFSRHWFRLEEFAVFSGLWWNQKRVRFSFVTSFWSKFRCHFHWYCSQWSLKALTHVLTLKLLLCFHFSTLLWFLLVCVHCYFSALFQRE